MLRMGGLITFRALLLALNVSKHVTMAKKKKREKKSKKNSI